MEPLPYIAEPAVPHVTDGTFDVTAVEHADCGDCLDQAHHACTTAAATGSVGATASVAADGEVLHSATVRRHEPLPGSGLAARLDRFASSLRNRPGILVDRETAVALSEREASTLSTLLTEAANAIAAMPPRAKARRTFLFDVSEEDFAQIGEAYVELFSSGDTYEASLAFRTDRNDMWGPPVPGRQTS